VTYQSRLRSLPEARPGAWLAAETNVSPRMPDNILSSARGVGLLVQRDYWAVIAGCRLSPSALVDELADHFSAFAPPDVVTFARADGTARPLERGDVLEVRIRGAGTFRVCLACRTSQTLTLATLTGHPEAGRITFGAYRNDYRDVVFHIRSRARSSTRARQLGFMTMGEAMQTATWADFVTAVAFTFGEGVIGYLHAETYRIHRRRADALETSALSPTFVAEGDWGLMMASTPEWRFGNGWTDEALSARLAALVTAIEGAPKTSSVGARRTALDLASFERPEHLGHLRHVASTGVLARESVGAPEPGGPFARASDLLARYELSDPAIVTAHFDRGAPLLRRPMLLEIKVLGLRYLCAVIVGDVVAEASDHETRFAFRVDTLVPHLERGSEWFILTKSHRDGLVRFSITALWEPGQFPNRWSRLGFALLARRYQRAWHRRAFRRLRDRLGREAGGPPPPHGAGRPWTSPAGIGARAGLR
jgi:uncharacterized protein (UPF0548 family)